MILIYFRDETANSCHSGKWIAGLLKAEGKVITRPAAELILNKTGASMDLIRAELDKIISYCGDKNEVTEKDIEDICTTQTVSRIFDMIAAIASKTAAGT